MRPKIVIETPMALLTLEQQEEIWTLSRTCDVYEKDVNGVLWQVLDLSDGKDKSDTILVKSNKPIVSISD